MVFQLIRFIIDVHCYNCFARGHKQVETVFSHAHSLTCTPLNSVVHCHNTQREQAHHNQSQQRGHVYASPKNADTDTDSGATGAPAAEGGGTGKCPGVLRNK